MATHGEPGDDQNEAVMQEVGERMEEEAEAVVQVNRFWRLDADESELSSESDSDDEQQEQMEDPQEEEMEQENDENVFHNNNNRAVVLRRENHQGRQVLRIGPLHQAFVDENSRGFIYDDNFHNLFPHLFIAINAIRGQFILEGKDWFKEVTVSPEVLPLFEESVELLLDQPKPVGPFETPEQKAILNDYIEERKTLMLNAAREYHEANESRPGYEHKLGHLFPPKTSFDMIEYFRVAFRMLHHPLPMRTSPVEYPELDEYTPETRMLIEKCISNHKTTEMREQIIALVESRTVLSKNNRTTLNELISEMNFMFNRNLEHNIIRKAREHRRRQRREMMMMEVVQPPQPIVLPAVEVERVEEVEAVQEAEAKRLQEQANAWAADNLQNNDQATRYVFDQEPSTSSSPSYIEL